jgi:hypothetical protein
VAGFFARLHRDGLPDGWQWREAQKLIRKLTQYAPGLGEELLRPERTYQGWFPNHSGILERRITIRADGPLLHGYLTVFAAKVGMALYREHIGSALPLDGAVVTQWFLNAGLAQNAADALLRILPAGATLQQGKWNEDEQFAYRYNSDDKSIVAALARFHQGLYTFTVATSTPSCYPFPDSMPSTMACVRPGHLLELMPTKAPRASAE